LPGAESSFASIGLIDDAETDQRLASRARKRLKDLRLHVTRLGDFAVVLLVVELFPSPALKAKPPLFERHTADTA